MKVLEINVNAGYHDRENTPITLLIPKNEIGEGIEAAYLNDLDLNKNIPVQFEELEESYAFSWIIDRLEKNLSKKYILYINHGESDVGIDMKLIEKNGRIDILSGDFLITSYIFGGNIAKPYLYPLNAPKGISITEDGPKDHIHHRSLWTAHGDVNGVDIWSEHEGHGYIRHKVFLKRFSGKVFSEIVASNIWISSTGEKLLDEIRRIRIWNISTREWIIDYGVKLISNYTDIILGDTKEAGIISVRVAPTMTVKSGYGRITNSYGGINEEETWGRKAFWCDYTGYLGGEKYGIALFDYIGNPRSPTYWHVRNYGLMTANIFGLKHFIKAKPGTGNLLIEKGLEKLFRYRIYMHRNDAVKAKVKEKYIDYIYPPKITYKIK